MTGAAHAYVLGFESGNRRVSGVQQLESAYPKATLPMVSIIFDPWGDDAKQEMSSLSTTLGANRIYHLTLSPNPYTAEQVANGMFDSQYLWFFQQIKKQDLKVVFRTMHEFNGGRYMRSSDPDNFKKARIRVRNLSRQAGLDQHNILFSLSQNARDLPRDFSKQYEAYTFCYPSVAAKLGCHTAEQYYPGDQYVDLMGFTFYNRGKGNANRRRQTPDEIVNAGPRNVVSRLETHGKPLFIDEVGTTAVRYTGSYNQATSRAVYQTDYTRKNLRLDQLKDFLNKNPAIVGAIYFNIDRTNGLADRMQGECDRSAIDVFHNKIYYNIRHLVDAAEPVEDSQLFHMFQQVALTVNKKEIRINDNDMQIGRVVKKIGDV